MIIDLARVIIGSFSGNSRKRELAGAGAAILVVSLVFASFTAWVSQPRYADILQGLGDGQAWALSITIAFTMYFLLSIIGGDLMRFQRYNTRLPEYFAYVCFVAFSIGVFDVVKNWEGSEDRARIERVDNAFSSGAAALPYSMEIAELKAEKKAIHNEYRHRGGALVFRPQPHTRHSKTKFKSDEKRVAVIDQKLTEFEQAQSVAMVKENERVDRLNGIAESKEESSKSGLQWLSAGIYILQLILAFCWTSVSARLDEMDDTETISSTSQKDGTSYEDLTDAEVSDTDEQPKGTGVGYQYGKGISTHADRGGRKIQKIDTTDGYKIKCRNCQKTVYMKSARAKYCSTKCRQNSYNKRTGKDLHNSIKA